MKILSPYAHGILDYVVVLACAAAPSLFAFSSTPAAIAYTLAAVHLVVTLATAFPLGLVKLIPFPAHGVLESLAAVAVVVMPWIAGFGGELAARTFFIAAGIVILAVVALTDYRAAARTPHAQVLTPAR